jgi:class 3 adenylate cyclase/tetratricopeptide (TPR) repeat protein
MDDKHRLVAHLEVSLPMPAYRRHLTILSCDIVNSTGYADSMDPEDFEVLMTQFHETCRMVVENHRGTFAHHTGDGFIAYFGSPRTQGRNAQEAIACGWALTEALSHQIVPKRSGLQVRIGIATGLVVVSTIDRQNNASNTFAIGGPVHLAARIQALASPGAVFVDSTTYTLARRNFEFMDRGTHLLKGFAESRQIWEAGPPRPLEFRFEERTERLTPLVGRVQELEVLDERWRLVHQGAGQTVLISGEAGIGKSRLLFEFIERSAPGHPLIFQCLEGHENEPLHVWINHIRHSAQVMLNDPVEERRRKAGEFFDKSVPGLGWLRPVMLSLVARDDNELDAQYDSNPAYRLDALRSAIVDYVVLFKEKGPKVVVVEDIHWIDPSSEEVLASLVARVAHTRVLLLVTCRTDKIQGKALGFAKHLPIDRLSTVHAAKLAGHVLEGRSLSEGVLARVVERSDGIPLYVEELARTVSQTAPAQDAGATDESVAGHAARLAIPDSLQGTLLARLDALGEARELAQIASVIGQEFNIEVLSRLAARPMEALQEDLTTLVESGVVRLLNNAVLPRLEFKHALIRQAAYNSLLRRDAVKLHSALATIYQKNFPDIGSTTPEILAQHLTVSGRWLDAASLWLQAGLSAKEMGSTIEAMARLDRCLQCLESAGSSSEALAIRMRCQMVRGVVIYTHLGPFEPRVQQALTEAAELAATLQDQDAMVDSLTSLSLVRYNSADFPAAISVANEMVGYGAKHDNQQASATGLMVTGMCHFATGRFHQARTDLEEAIVKFSQVSEKREANEGRALVYLAVTLHILGKAPEANRLTAVAIELARRRRALDLAVTLGNSLYLSYMQGDVEQTRRIGTELEQVAGEKGLLMWYHHARFFLGWADALANDRAGLETMEASMNRFRNAQEVVEQSLFYGLLAERYLDAGLRQRAFENVEAGLDLVTRFGERFFEVPLLQIKARCLAGAPEVDSREKAAELSARAKQLAQEQGALAWS